MATPELPVDPSLLLALTQRLADIRQAQASLGMEAQHLTRLLATYEGKACPAAPVPLGPRWSPWEAEKYINAALAVQEDQTILDIQRHIQERDGKYVGRNTIGWTLRRGRRAGTYSRRGSPRQGYQWSFAHPAPPSGALESEKEHLHAHD